MVCAVQCPNPQCRKYQIVEERDRDKVVACLICKSAIKVSVSEKMPTETKTNPIQS